MITTSIPSGLKTRDIIKDLVVSLKDFKAVVLMGSRQAGKTFLLYLLVEHLRQKKVQEKQLFFFDLENIKQTDFLNSFVDFDAFPKFLVNQGANLSQKTYVFIDEIQHLRNPSRFIKYLVDHYRPNLKFILSGSSTLAIKRKFTDSMVGRIIPYIIHPLKFSEWLFFSNKEILAKNKQELNIWQTTSDYTLYDTFSLQQEWENFCLFGGYPQTASLPTFKEKEELLGQIYSLYVRKDIKNLENIPDTSAFNKLVSLLAYQAGNLIQTTELAVNTQISRPTINKYLFLLENTFIIHLVRPYFTNPRSEYVKLPKVYFEDTGLRNYIAGSLARLTNRPDFGAVVENAVYLELLKSQKYKEINFWRSERGAEVDFVLRDQKGSLSPLEIKYQPFKQTRVSTGMRSFIQRYHPQKAFVGTKNFWGKEKLKKTEIIFLPVWGI